MESEYRGMTTNEVMIEQIKAGHISFADIADYLNDRTDAERNDFCFRMFCSIPMEPITISMEIFRDYDAIPYSEEHRPSYHEVKSMNLTPQQELEKDRLLNAIGFIESKYGVDLFGEYQDEQPNNLESTESSTSRELKELMNLMPENLRTERAHKVFGKAFEKGLITKSDNGFSWEKSNVLLCFMFGRLYCGDCTFDSKFNGGKPMWKKGVDMLFPESCIEEVFRIKNTSQSRTQAKSVPNGYNIVEDIFKAV